MSEQLPVQRERVSNAGKELVKLLIREPVEEAVREALAEERLREQARAESGRESGEDRSGDGGRRFPTRELVAVGAFAVAVLAVNRLRSREGPHRGIDQHHHGSAPTEPDGHSYASGDGD